MVVNICPNMPSMSETLSSLNFAARARTAMLSLGNRDTIKKWKDIVSLLRIFGIGINRYDLGTFRPIIAGHAIRQGERKACEHEHAWQPLLSVLNCLLYESVVAVYVSAVNHCSENFSRCVISISICDFMMHACRKMNVRINICDDNLSLNFSCNFL